MAFVLAVSDGAWAAAACIEGNTVRIWTAPLVARPGEKLEIMAVATDGELAELLVTDPAGRRSKLPAVKGGGPPWSLRGVTPRTSPRQLPHRGACGRARWWPAPRFRSGAAPRNRGSGEWDLATQALYAAWVEHLFDAPPEQSLSFPSLEPVLRDPQRNFLYDYLSKGEDTQFPAEPDCADLSFFLRAYFAWKLGLPVSYRACGRGSASSAAALRRCRRSTMPSSAPPLRPAPSAKMSRRLMDRVTSGGGRTALTRRRHRLLPGAA